MFWLGMMKHLAKIALVEVLPADRTALKMLRLGLDRPVVIFTLVAGGLVVSYFR
ncbi:hypothetical protein [Mesorhizobium sp.]|uniref:hypothetical protein n=1 Tax=Mesorhizobium sp. TaxID=1871066 RepID=UPI00257F48F2|nr:hypothetical protein [Mesorhizobium sp.]